MSVAEEIVQFFAAFGLLLGFAAALLMYYFPPPLIRYTRAGAGEITFVSNPTEEGKRTARTQIFWSSAAPWLLAVAFLLQLPALLFPVVQERQPLSSRAPSWGLPISLGQTLNEVRRILGAPNESLRGGAGLRERAGQVAEWYWSSGIVVTYQDGWVAEVMLFPNSDHRGFLPYSGSIVAGLTLNDPRGEFTRKLGSPTKVEHVEEGADLVTGVKAPAGGPSVWPAKEVLYWRQKQYVIEVAFLSQSQSVNAQKGVVLPKGSIEYVKIYR